MANITVCARFRPLSSRERRDHGGDSVCIERIDDEAFNLKDEKEGELKFGFDKVFYDDSKQDDVYSFLARPVVRDVVKAINGTIITYGQTGAGKTYSIEGPSILECDDAKKGLLATVVDGIFREITSADSMKYTIKLSMVEIYMEKVRDLLDLSKYRIQIKETKSHGILLPVVTEISLSDIAEALQSLSSGICNRAVGDTQMNAGSTNSHCIYIFSVHQESTKQTRTFGKLILVDLAGSEKVEKTGAEGRVLEEAKTINKSLSALGNVVQALTCGPNVKGNHIPYRNSKLTRILKDSLVRLPHISPSIILLACIQNINSKFVSQGGNSHMALLCCCSPSPSNASETLSTLRFGARAKHIKASPRVHCTRDKHAKTLGTSFPSEDESRDKVMEKPRESMDAEDVKLLQDLFTWEGRALDPNFLEDLEFDRGEVAAPTNFPFQQAVEELASAVELLKDQTKVLEVMLVVATRMLSSQGEASGNLGFMHLVLESLKPSIAWVSSSPLVKLLIDSYVLIPCCWFTK
ncbi:kinesin-like protein KIN-1 [Syzygium oleosum]|uniref:kinesin-like protein KIN-1 n=1 Tax=Syzygium oleosum TaxID=219896 RepID=UPI0024BB0F46|nr:kinesin-like protein KIN-1 [Syzygium oleosum]